MKKKILYGSCFATFLLLSIAFITPVHANSSDILKTLDRLSSKISEDEDFLNLLNDPDVEDYINLVLNKEGEWDEDFKDSVEIMINIIIDKQEFKDLVAKYEIDGDIDLLYDQISEKNPQQQNPPEDIYYTITDQTEGLEINKQENNPNPEDEDIIISSSDDSINIIGVGILNGFFLNLLIKLLNFITTVLNFAGKVVKTIHTVLSIAAFIAKFFNKPLETSLKAIIAIAATIRSVISITSTVISTIAGILEIFYKLIKPKSKSKSVIKTPFSNLIERINKFFRRFQIFKDQLFKPRARPIDL